VSNDKDSAFRAANRVRSNGESGNGWPMKLLRRDDATLSRTKLPQDQTNVRGRLIAPGWGRIAGENNQPLLGIRRHVTEKDRHLRQTGGTTDLPGESLHARPERNRFHERACEGCLGETGTPG
jgi:hypothetical protein